MATKHPDFAAPIPPTFPGRWLGRTLHRLQGRSAFFRNVSVMLAGSVIGQMTSVVLSPLLTRLFTPQEFGVLSVYTALLTILVVLASLRYEMTIPMAASDDDAINLVALCFGVLVLTTAAIAAFALLAPEGWLDRLWLTALAPYRYLLPIGFAGLGAYFIALYFATRAGAFPAIARTRIFQGVLGPLRRSASARWARGRPAWPLASSSASPRGRWACCAPWCWRARRSFAPSGCRGSWRSRGATAGFR